MNRPAQQVGGDYYDVLTLTDVGGDACLFCVADVSGKGLAASLLMSTIQATLRALLGREASLADLARRTNELLFATTPGSKYATAALVLAYPDTGECRYVSGGPHRDAAPASQRRAHLDGRDRRAARPVSRA